MSRPCSALRTAALLLAVGALAACGPRFARETVSSGGGIQVVLRTETKGGEPVARGFAHPVVIAGSRMANILSRIDVRPEGSKGGERKPAIPAELVYEIGDALAVALGRATPAQDVVVYATRHERRLGIFTDEYRTSLLVYAEGERLHVFLGELDALVPKSGETREEPPGEPDPANPKGHFRVLPSEAMAVASAQEVTVNWRDPVFREATALRVGPDGRVLRRTILMESPGAEAPAAEPADLPPNLSPDTLRKLADLEDARQRGEITESEYRTRRQEILREENP